MAKCAQCSSTAARWRCEKDGKVRCDAYFHVGKDGAAVPSSKGGYCCKAGATVKPIKIRVNRERLGASEPAISVHRPGAPVDYARRVDFVYDGTIVASVVQGDEESDRTVYMTPADCVDIEVQQ